MTRASSILKDVIERFWFHGAQLHSRFNIMVIMVPKLTVAYNTE